MLFETTLYTSCDACVERAVNASENVDVIYFCQGGEVLDAVSAAMSGGAAVGGLSLSYNRLIAAFNAASSAEIGVAEAGSLLVDAVSPRSPRFLTPSLVRRNGGAAPICISLLKAAISSTPRSPETRLIIENVSSKRVFG